MSSNNNNSNSIHYWLHESLLLVVLATACSMVMWPDEAMAQRGSDAVVVAPADDPEAARLQLEEQLRRFSDRFVTRITLATNQVRDAAENSEVRLRMLSWKSVSLSSMVELAIGQNAVTNLLDMMVMTRLSALVLENYWLPEVIGEAAGQRLLDDYRVLDEDIWQIADQVLTAAQQDSLRDLINEWHRENPDQVFPWYIRLNEFSGQRAADLRNVEQSGGLLGLRGARQSIDEMQAFAERIMFYLQRAPLLTSFALEESVARILQGQEVTSVIEDSERFTTAAEELVAVVAQLPSDQFAAIDQFMLRLSEQRSAFLNDIEGTGPQSEAVLREMRQSFESIERIMTMLDVGGEAATPGPGPDIDGYRGLIVDAANTARELRLAIETTEQLLSSAAWADRELQTTAAIDRVETVQRSLIDRLAIAAIVVIAFFFVALLGYRIIAARILAPRGS